MYLDIADTELNLNILYNYHSLRSLQINVSPIMTHYILRNFHSQREWKGKRCGGHLGSFIYDKIEVESNLQINTIFDPYML